VLGHRLDRISERNRLTRDFSLSSLTRALQEVVSCFGVYRTYVEPDRVHVLRNGRIERSGGPELANERLEALRRMAVLSWHYGFTVPGDDVASFTSAGFSPDQYELMVRSIRAAIGSPQRIAA